MGGHSASVGFRGVAAKLAPHWHSLADLEAAGLLISTRESLAEFGFEGAHVCQGCPEQLALDAARSALNDAALEPYEIDAVIWASARAENHLVGGHLPTSSRTSDVLAGFRYGAAWLQEVLDLRNAVVMAVAQQGCSTMISALRLARSLILAEPDRCRHVLCVGMDVLPAGATREILYNVISDGACAVVASLNCPTDAWLGCHQISRGYLWDTPACDAEILAAYFPVARELILQLLTSHELSPEAVDVVVPTAVNPSSWELLLRLVGIPQDRLCQRNWAFGHTMTSDSFVFLEAMRRSASIPRGSRLLLFTYGFGSSWSGVLLEH